MLNVLTRQHEWFRTSDNWGENCKHCYSVIGIGTGTDGVTTCNERFDFKKFQDFIEFRNFSLIKSNKKIKKYIKRFSNDIKTENQLLSEYFQTMKLNKIQIKQVKLIIKNIKK